MLRVSGVNRIMAKFKKGDIAVTSLERVFKVTGLTKGLYKIPDGFLIDQNGGFVNPKYCRKYDGALSAVEHLLEAKPC